MERSGELPLNELPEGCIANALSFTTPLDVARLAAVSPMFKSAAISNVVWERFLPSDVEHILSTSPDGSLLLESVSSKRELYFSLCDNPILVDNGRRSFSLEKKSGKKRYMLSAMDLVITWSHTPRYWKWNSNPASRFPEVAELITVCWLEIRGKINTSMLSPSILYTANLVFKFCIEAYGLDDQPVEVAMKLDGDKISADDMYLPEKVMGIIQRDEEMGGWRLNLVTSFAWKGKMGLVQEVKDAQGGFLHLKWHAYSEK
ncbi:hypothetical protein DKX38_027721 [Salix brachista]|uniref:F-box domain-containing protein n=1 Tax=Salix brachista TaxID=2182728 RepID=A0A5N5J8J9_9ROSI|nr:hypothetical protein DKX38_027721 [Salix brachista]